MKTVLLIDDDPQIRIVYGLVLRSNGYRVVEADSGVAGLAMAQQHLPDLILTDINMPGGDGSTLLRDLRSDPKLRSKQIVLITGRPDLVSPRKGMDDGADDFLVKPLTQAALLSCVEARLNRASVNWRVEDETLAQLRTTIPSQLPHEFFTPLAGIIGLMDILRADFPGLEEADVIDIHNDIYESAIRLNRTLRNYLLILDLQNASPVSIPTPLAASEIEESIRTGVHEALRQSKREDDVTVQIESCSIKVNSDDLSRMVEELVDNACKFSRRGTPVTVRLSSDGFLQISDQGRGLTSDEIARIGAFQQFDRKKYEQQGLGLGLVLVQKLASRAKAAFSIESQPGKETRTQVAFNTLS